MSKGQVQGAGVDVRNRIRLAIAIRDGDLNTFNALLDSGVQLTSEPAAFLSECKSPEAFRKIMERVASLQSGGAQTSLKVELDVTRFIATIRGADNHSDYIEAIKGLEDSNPHIVLTNFPSELSIYSKTKDPLADSVLDAFLVSSRPNNSNIRCNLEPIILAYFGCVIIDNKRNGVPKKYIDYPNRNFVDRSLLDTRVKFACSYLFYEALPSCDESRKIAISNFMMIPQIMWSIADGLNSNNLRIRALKFMTSTIDSLSSCKGDSSILKMDFSSLNIWAENGGRKPWYFYLPFTEEFANSGRGFNSSFLPEALSTYTSENPEVSRLLEKARKQSKGYEFGTFIKEHKESVRHVVAVGTQATLEQSTFYTLVREYEEHKRAKMAETEAVSAARTAAVAKEQAAPSVPAMVGTQTQAVPSVSAASKSTLAPVSVSTGHLLDEPVPTGCKAEALKPTPYVGKVTPVTIDLNSFLVREAGATHRARVARTVVEHSQPVVAA